MESSNEAVNNAGLDQKYPTMIIAPSGKLLFEVVSDDIAIATSELNLSDVSNSVLAEARTDVVRVTA